MSVINNSLQRIVAEEFTTEPQLHVEESRSPIEENGTTVSPLPTDPCACVIGRRSELSFHIQPADNVPETPPGALPADVVAYLYPSRYCESDKLVRLAQHEFGRLQPAFRA